MTTISTLPPAPQPTDDTSTFNSKAFALLAALAGFVTEANAQAGENNTAASNAAASAVAALVSKLAAAASEAASANSATLSAASAGAPAWVSGTTYAQWAPVMSPLDRRVYRRKTAAGSGTTDPSLDTTNWAAVAPNGLAQNPVGTTSSSCPAGMDTCFTNSAACSATAPASPAINDEFAVRFDNGRRDNTLDLGSNVLIGPNGQTLTGVVTLNIPGPLHLRWWSDSKWRTA